MAKTKKSKEVQCLSEKGCDGTLSLKKIEHKLKVKKKTVIVPNVEVWECDRCGERFYPYEASKKIDMYKEYSGRLMLRIEPEIHLKLTRLAKQHRRSLNQEISYLLETITQKSA